MNVLYFNQKYLSNVPKKYLDGSVLFVPEPWLFFRNKLIKTLCHITLSPRINSKIKLPFKSVWIKYILKHSFVKKDTICLVINAHFYHLYKSGIKRIAESLYKKVHIVFVFSDKVQYFAEHYRGFPDIEELKESFDAVITYNVADSKKYNLILDRPCFPSFEKIDDKLGDFHSDLFFVGSNKGRLNDIYKVFELCRSNGIKCDFHVIGVPKENIKYSDCISFNKPIPYSEVLERSKKTNCILYIVQEEGSGVVLRDYEALTFNKLLLTNNTALELSGLYSKEQVIWLDELAKRKNDIIAGYKGSNALKIEYSLQNWIKWLEDLLIGDKTICSKN